MPKEKSIHQHLPFALFFVVLLFLFAACSSAPSAPSESEGKRVLDEKGAQLNLFRVKTFKKTNAIGDERTYTMEYEAQLECLQSDTGPMAYPGFFSINCQTKGQVINTKGELVFEKTESGWRKRR